MTTKGVTTLARNLSGPLLAGLALCLIATHMTPKPAYQNHIAVFLTAPMVVGAATQFISDRNNTRRTVETCFIAFALHLVLIWLVTVTGPHGTSEAVGYGAILLMPVAFCCIWVGMAIARKFHRTRQ